MNQWWHRTQASDTFPDMPWLGPDVITFLQQILQETWKVAEFGSGGSTVWMAERVSAVTTVESSAEWLEVVQDNIPENVDLLYSEQPGPPKKILSGDYDMLLIDGEPVENRRNWIMKADQIVRPGGIIVLDNANRPEYADALQQLETKAKLVRWIDQNNATAGTKYLVTAFYQLPAERKKKAKEADNAGGE